ncbi:hypothetical protein RB623_03005 [Mesorhizobium sp. LHD-90]|uniref:hypothetical protein n=1 Tax=Mesorhizobium sp. LHD-90 TaxID=3071414 RepID=UPI0027E08D19|nr:hypothetical protein [Mesorhizobium sp. LHD-90]MDQ6433018.1 hypothetical protein [Mesorhizobium sp. LHD-90]
MLTTAGTPLSGYFSANATELAADANGRVTYETDTGTLRCDGNTADSATLFISLTNLPAITYTGFVAYSSGHVLISCLNRSGYSRSDHAAALTARLSVAN